MSNEPYDPYIPGDAGQGASNPKTAAIQAQIDDTVHPNRVLTLMLCRLEL
jgi:hypothetical protein